MKFLYLSPFFPLEFLCAQVEIIAVNGRDLSGCTDERQSPARHYRSTGIFSELRLENPMMDIVMVALAVGFFAVSIAYVYACEQL